MPSVRTEAVFDVTPQKVAELYWQMDCDEQAKFWNHLGLISMHKLCLQSCYTSQSPELMPCGKDAVQTLAAHFE